MKSYLRRICFAFFIIIAIMAPIQLYAACQIVGTTIDGYIVVCDGPDTIGINSGNGSDIVTINTGAQVSKTDLQSAEAFAAAGATAVDAGNGNNRITNRGSVGANAGATASLKVDTPSQATAKATAIKAGSGADVIRNSSTIDATATSTSNSGGANATSEATATGIDAGDSNDRITNNSAITATSTATTSSNGVTLTGIGIATYASPTNATATSKGIKAGKGSDTINNTKDITASATSTANALNVSIGLFGYETKTYGDASTKAIANAMGVAGSDGNDRVTNAATGTITATSNATASTKDISVEIVGGVKSNSSTTAYSSSTGIDGRNGKDTITNNGAITVKAISEVDALGVDAKFLGIPTKLAEWGGAKLGDAKTVAQSTAKGIDGGEGDNKITNSGTIDVYAKAEADSADITTSITVTTLGGGTTPQASVSSGNLQVPSVVGATGASTQTSGAGTENSGEGNEVTDIGTVARTYATGIDGGTGGNTITNNNKILVKAESEADSVSVNPSISFSKGGWKNILPGTALTNATTTAQSTATGIVGGVGNDTITNRDQLSSESISNSTSTSVSVLLKGVKEKGLAWGGALSDATTKAISTATGIDGGGGNDTITNSGKIKATATPDANSTSIGATLMAVEEGLTAGFAYVDAKTTAEATAIGIGGGSGNDTITNKRTGEIEVTANPTSGSTKVGVTVSGAFSQEWSAAIGGSITNGNTQATSNATGISGGDGNDTVTNSGNITVNTLPDAHSASVSATLTGAGDGLTVGFTYADNTTKAEANAVGIDGGAGNDTLINARTGKIEVTANPASSSTTVGVTLTGVTKGTGIVGGAALTDGTTTATGNATGISGGEGNDTVTNAGKIIVKSNPDADSASVSVNLGTSTGELGLVGGFSYANNTTTAQATAIGIDGGPGNDTITNKRTGEIEVTANPTSSSASVTVTAQGVKGMGAAVGISLTDGTTKSISSATGIAGGEGDDTIINSGKITVNALPEAHSASVSVSLSAAKEGVAAGGTFADATTTVQATGIGIDGGAGNDTITNSGTIQVTSTASMAAASVSVNAGMALTGAALGVALADGKTVATSSAIGIDGGAGDNTLTNRGSNTVSATSDVTAASVGVNLEGTKAGLAAGASLVDGENKAEALAIGIRSGSGNDTIRNENKTRAEATATSTRTNVAFSGTFALYGVALGASAADATNTATADARGIEGGGGNDNITNTSDLVTVAKTTADTNSVSISANVAIFGVGLGASIAKAETTGTALATGIHAGNGDNTITNTSTGSIQSTSTAYADAFSVSVNLIGAVGASAGSTASATSAGISSGGGTDTLRNEGSINLTATSNTDASAYSGQLLGYGDSNAKGISNATVKGIDGGDGVNTLINIGSITGTATANANASSYDFQLSGGGNVTAGTDANATALGIAGGKDVDTIRNEGTINLTAQSTLVSEGRSYQLFGIGIADVDSKAVALSTGIDGGNGNNGVTNTSTGSITVSSNASATATGLSATIGIAAASASTTSKAHSTGIKSGSGEDTITNEGTLNVKATSSTYAGSGDLSLVGLSFGDALTEAITEGIVAGDGRDVITNKGTIAVGTVQDNDHPMAYSNVDSVSMSLFNISSATFGSKAQATGITGDGGDDTIINTGTITVGDDHWMAKGRAFGFSGQFIDFLDFTSVGATAETVSTGIDGDDGNDGILNDSDGALTVKASSYAWTKGAAKISTFGSPAAFAGSTTKATATGISGGKGDDVIENKGNIDVYAHSWADAYTDSWVGWGSPYADSTADATATAIGIDAGGGQNLVTNSGAIHVSALAETTPYAKADSDVDKTESESTSYSKSNAFGVVVGDDNNTVNNTAKGTITVTAVARTSDAQNNVATAISDEDAAANAAPASVAIGIQAGKGNNFIFNDGQMTVTSEVHAKSHASASSTLYTATATSKAGGSADAVGIKVGDGNNTIKNNGTLTVTATNEGIALSDYPTAHLDDGYTYAGDGKNTSLTSSATGISAGNGVNLIETYNSMTVLSSVNADARAYTNTATTTTYAEAYAGGNAKATGISVGNGQNTINNYGHMTVRVTADAYALGNAEEYGSAYIGTESSPGIIADAVGISAGHGINQISNDGILEVNATTTAAAEAAGDESIQTVANSYATATGIRTGDGANTVTNLGMMNVTANGLGASAIGISTGTNNDRILIGLQGTLTVRSTAAAVLGNINALATGVDAGSGNNHVENYGSIDVTTEAVRLLGDTQPQSFGIKTGSGNDLIIQSGRISTENRLFDLLSFPPHWSSSPGIAISSGAGNDTVILMNGSETIGHIDLGDGNDWLTVTGTPIVNGNVTGGNGIDTLVFQGAGSVGFTPTNFENAIKQGAGTYTASNLPTMQRIEIKQGVLQVNNNYQFSNNGFFQTVVNGDGSFGQFKVNGATQLAGDLSVLKGPGPYKNGTTYNVIETGAQGVGGGFTNILLPETKPLLRFAVNQRPSAVEVEVHAKSFTTVATNRVEWTTGNYLDRIVPAAMGDLSNALGEFQSLSLSQFGTAFSSLSPDSYDNYTRATYDSMWQYTRSLQRRLANIRAYANAAGYDPDSKPLLLAFAGSDASLGELLATGRISQTQAKNGLWFNGYGQWGDQEPDKGFTGFDYNIYGGTLGFDHAFNDKMTAGLSLGYSRTDVDLDHHQGDGTIKTFAGSLYGSYFTKNAFLEGAVSYGRNWYDNDRLITIGPILRKASSDHEGDLFSAYLGGGYAFDVKNWAIGPFVSLRYIYLSEESFQEKGADGLNLSVGHRNTDSLTSELGLRLARVFDVKYGSLIPEASAAWSYDFDIDDRIITASFQGSPGTAFSIDGQPVEKNGAVLGTGLTFIHKSGFSTSLRYRGEFREKYQSHGVMGEFRLMF
ncbi:MAG TPA: autotransporter outer membrane beta-barrel domain-containing protein [Thermodesulfobacteriota bacterium]|nr:autotransporter outer membrane beta-barrel domain-containing protein [Thermodesulfobacteriota bacterium]